MLDKMQKRKALNETNELKINPIELAIYINKAL